MAESGWNRPISETPGYDLQSTINALGRLGHSSAAANTLLRRTHLSTFPWNTGPLLTRSIARTYDLKPAAAALIACRLVDVLSQVAADQRDTTSSSAGRYRIADLDALVQDTMAVVDVHELDSAVRLGVCDVADYTRQTADTRSQFLQGIDGTPAHIGSNFDLLRPTPFVAIQSAIKAARYALIAGPSGSGKSTQMWRSARDVATAVQVIRVHRLETDSDVGALVRHVQLLGPNDTYSVVVCCDDLGRPRTHMWPTAARRLLELRGVALLGAVRREDLTAELLRHGGVLVELRLDDEEATAIGNQLAHADVHLCLEIPEAVRLADGQLMEFISLLTTGQRLRSVLADQVESLMRAGEETTLRVARLVCASHVIGVELNASSLREAIDDGRQGTLALSLLRLQDEHIITTVDQSSWRGLHQLRSEVLTELLHKTPPPTRTSTLIDVLSILKPSALGWGLRRVAELFGSHIDPQPHVVSLAIHKCKDARELATLFEGLERADHSWTARSYIPVIDRHRTRGVKLLAWALLVCAKKLAGIDFGSDGDGPMGELGRRVGECARDLPPRSRVFCDSAANALGNETLLYHLARAPLDDAVRLLEALAPYVSLSDVEQSRISAAFDWPSATQSIRAHLMYGRLLDACEFTSTNPEAFVDVFGPPSERLNKACQAHPNVISVTLSGDGKRATVGLLADPREESGVSQLAWDSEAFHDRSDPINHRAVELASYVGECCPELDIVEVRTVIADGTRFTLGDENSSWEPGYKRLARDARPRRSEVRVNAGIKAAIIRQVAAFSWTELIRAREEIAHTATELVASGVRRLSSHDNSARRAEWCRAVQETVDKLADLPAPPVERNWEPNRSAATWDSVQSDDGMTDAIGKIVTALQALVTRPPESLEHVRLSAQLGVALKKLVAACSDSQYLTTVRGTDVYQRLTVEVTRLRSLLVAASHDPAVIERIKGPPSRLAAVVDEVVERSASTRIGLERRALEAVFSNVEGVVLQDVASEDLFPTSVRGHEWIVRVAPEAWVEAMAAASDLDRDVVRVAVTLVCVADDFVLPIALGLSWRNGGFLTVSPEDIARIATKMNRSTVPAGRQMFFANVLEELGLASWKIARTRLRPPEWVVIDDLAPQDHLGRAHQRLHEEGGGTELVAVLQELSERVQREMLGGESRPVAAAIAAPSPLDARDTDSDDVAELVVRGTLLAVEEELRSCLAETSGQDVSGSPRE